jgi:hypothetical protein
MIVPLSNRQHADANVLASDGHDGASRKFVVCRDQNSSKHFDLIVRAIQLGRSQVHKRWPKQICVRQQRREIAIARYQDSLFLCGPR